MAVDYAGCQEFRKGSLIACYYDPHTAAAVGWTESEGSVLVWVRLYSMMVLDFGTEWDTVAIASYYRDSSTVVSLRLGYCFHPGSLVKPDMGQEWSDMTGPEVRKSSEDAATSDSYTGC